MSFTSRWVHLWRRSRNRAQTERHLDEEIRGYYEMQAERLVPRGLSPAEASRAVKLEFGGPEQAKEKVRDARFGRAI